MVLKRDKDVQPDGCRLLIVFDMHSRKQIAYSPNAKALFQKRIRSITPNVKSHPYLPHLHAFMRFPSPSRPYPLHPVPPPSYSHFPSVPRSHSHSHSDSSPYSSSCY